MIVKRVGVWSAARMYAAITAAFGLVGGIVFALIALAGASISPEAQGWMGPVFGVGAIIFMPVVYGIMGLVIGAVSAALYNVFAGMVGGLSLDVE
jgi:hypothetical protein